MRIDFRKWRKKNLIHSLLDIPEQQAKAVEKATIATEKKTKENMEKNKREYGIEPY